MDVNFKEVGDRRITKVSSQPVEPGVGGFDQLLEQFKKAAYQTPGERARAMVLERHRLSESDYEKLSPDRRQMIDREIAAAVELAMRKDKRKTA